VREVPASAFSDWQSLQAITHLTGSARGVMIESVRARAHSSCPPRRACRGDQEVDVVAEGPAPRNWDRGRNKSFWSTYHFAIDYA
jgi:hypothetical protein